MRKREEKRGDTGKHEKDRECVRREQERGEEREREIRGKLQIWWPGFPVRTDLSSAAPSDQLSALQGE